MNRSPPPPLQLKWSAMGDETACSRQYLIPELKKYALGAPKKSTTKSSIFKIEYCVLPLRILGGIRCSNYFFFKACS